MFSITACGPTSHKTSLEASAEVVVLVHVAPVEVAGHAVELSQKRLQIYIAIVWQQSDQRPAETP